MTDTAMQGMRGVAPAEPYWASTATDLFSSLGSAPTGLSSPEAAARSLRFGPNVLDGRRQFSALGMLVQQIRNPLTLLLIGAAIISLLVAEWLDAAIILVIVAASVGIGFWREFDAGRAVEKLLSRLVIRVGTFRDGVPVQVPVAGLVPGDVIQLRAGSLVPGDAVLLEARDFFVSQGVLTGESFPVEKSVGVVGPEAGLVDRRNCIFMGTSVRSGTASALVVRTGMATRFGGIAASLRLRPAETGFERKLRQFGFLLMKTALLLVIITLAVNVYLHRPVVESLLFAVALAVGLSPELLPAILSVNLARSARRMAESGVIVRRLNAIENLGSMDVLCCDKTGTLTEGEVRLHGAFDALGEPSPEVLRLAAINAAFDTGLANPLDEALLEAGKPDLGAVEKLEEIPFDFLRKRVSVVVREGCRIRMIEKGAFEPLLATLRNSSVDSESLGARFNQWSEQGYRVLGVALSGDLPLQARWHKEDERDLHFAGFLVFHDPPKPDVQRTLAELGALGVTLKIITGDAAPVARHVAGKVGLPPAGVLTGRDLGALSDDALGPAAEAANVFAEVDPNQKERILLALKKRGHVVGFMGDGINDAPALHAADVGISVDQAADVAKEAADLVLLEHNLDALRRGIVEGRTTSANTLKYVLATTSANFGNMVSMSAASLFLPFLPLLAAQILLNNFLADIPAFALASDRVDPELIERPRPWDMALIRRFMIAFGLLSSLFDFLTFGVLLLGFGATPELFRTGWFVESLLTALLVALTMRTRRPLWKSLPGRALLISTALVMAVALAIPYAPHARGLGFVPLPPAILLSLLAITIVYLGAVELLKHRLYGRGSIPRCE